MKREEREQTTCRLSAGFGLLALIPGVAGAGWEPLAEGLALGTFSLPTLSETPAEVTIVRVDPSQWQLGIYAVDELELESGLTAREWSERYGLAVAINAGMFAKDFETHVGYMKNGDHVQNGHVNRYESVAAFSPRKEDLPAFRIADLDRPGVEMDTITQDYDCVIQNLRLIKRSGENRWPQQLKRWSEAALGEDDEGRALFIFCRSALSMHDLNEGLLTLGIGIVCAQHLEGGPEAQLYLGLEERELELVGSFETGFRENDGNWQAWPVPNVIGVRAK